MENITTSELEEHFDNYLDRVGNGESFIVDDKVVLTSCDDYSWLCDHYDGC
jgi:hypothetical protein